MASNQPKSVILVDTSHLIYRCWHAHKMLMARDGTRTGVIHGVLSNILSVAKKMPDCSFIFAWEGGKTWRQTLSQDYKANRGSSTDPEYVLIKEQFEPLQKVLDTIGFQQFKISGLEGDDVIGVLSRALENNPSIQQVYIYSGDRDFFQLINNKVLVLRMDVKKGLQVFKAKDVKIEFGILPEEWVKMRALSGDPSDNMKPIPGIGPKKAVGLLHAGMDSSKPNFEDLPMSVRKQYRDFKFAWHKVVECYAVSLIPRDETFSKFTPEVSLEVKKMINTVTENHGRIARSPAEKDRNLTSLTKLLAGYELAEILGNRTLFWVIP